MSPPNVIRMLRWFEKHPRGRLVGEAELTDLSLSVLQQAFGAQPDDPMYDCWVVEESHLELLKRHSSEGLDLETFDYFVEADTRVTPEEQMTNGVNLKL